MDEQELLKKVLDNQVMGVGPFDVNQKLQKSFGYVLNPDPNPESVARAGVLESDRKAPKVTITDPSGKLSGKYSSGPLKDIIDAAKVNGVNPALALAMSGQETAFGKYGSWNPLHMNHSHGFDRLQTLDNAMQFLKKRMTLGGNDPELQIQAYNGLGQIPAGMYGSLKSLNGAVDKPYGKSVLNIQSWLENVPDIQSLIQGKALSSALGR